MSFVNEDPTESELGGALDVARELSEASSQRGLAYWKIFPVVGWGVNVDSSSTAYELPLSC